MQIGNTQIIDTFAEAFRMRYVRLLITAHDDYWLNAALQEFTGYGASVIACDAEVGVERMIPAGETPDGRVGSAVLIFGFSTDALASAVPNRVGQCVMTCPTTAVFNGLPDCETTVPLGKHLRFFGDGFQKSKKYAEQRYWRIPVMDGEFLIEETAGVTKGIAGGNIILQAEAQAPALAAVRRVTEAIAPMPNIMAPFPAGVVRSGSKVGSKYKQLVASTNHSLCPTLRGRVTSELVDGVNCVYEIVIDGTSEEAIAEALAMAIQEAVGDGVLAIGAGNYGGKLGKFHFHLHELLQ